MAEHPHHPDSGGHADPNDALLWQLLSGVHDDTPPVRRAFAADLRSALVHTEGSARRRRSSVHLRVLPTPDQRAEPPSGRRRWRPIAAAAICALLLVAAAALYNGDQARRDLAFLPAAEATAPPPAVVVECAAYLKLLGTYADGLDRSYIRLLAAQVPAVSRPSPTQADQWISLIPTSALPSGEEPSRITAEKINLAVAREHACAATTIPHGLDGPAIGTSLPDTAMSASLGATATPQSIPFVAVTPASATQTLLADGRVGALVWKEGWEGEVGTYIVFAPAGDDWIPSEVAAVASDAYITAHPGARPTERVSIYLDDVRVLSIPTRFDLTAGTPVELAILNDGTRERRFTIPDAGVELALAPGERRSITIELTAGGHRYGVDVDAAQNLISGGWLWAFPRSTATPAAAFGPTGWQRTIQCDAPARPRESFEALRASVEAGVDPPVSTTAGPGTPVDAATVAAVEATVHELTECRNVHQVGRHFGLWTDEAILRAAHSYGPEGSDWVETLIRSVDVLDGMEGTPEGVPIDRIWSVEAVEDVRRLSDGRVQATVVYGTVEGELPLVTYFAVRGDTYLLDDTEGWTYDVDSDGATPPETPTAG